MHYLIYVLTDIDRLGIAADSEFQLPLEGKGSLSLEEYVREELGLEPGEWEAL